ncbi:MAG: Queuosine precursor transporter QueT [Tenericutes bacterium ADurb.Bin087]|nr:MAG: Queuosine precursor transporter QueT [Tenericutes bacterium ADurb.Bin087]
MNKKKIIRRITDNALIAAIYYVVTILLGGFAFNDVQFRISEILLFLIFFRKDFVIGVTLGCLLANLHSPLQPWDAIFGTVATLFSGLLIAFSKRMFWGVIWPTILNAIIVGFMLHFILNLPLFATMGLVALGEFVVLLLGYGVFSLIGKQPAFLNLIMADERKEENDV